MQYEIIATVRLLIIAGILGLIAAELRRSVQICNFSRGQSLDFLSISRLSHHFSSCPENWRSPYWNSLPFLISQNRSVL